MQQLERPQSFPSVGLPRAAEPPQSSVRGAIRPQRTNAGEGDDALDAFASRVAQVLHDGAGQLVFALRLGLSDLGRDMDGAGRQRIEELLGITNDLDRQLRLVEHEVAPAVLEQGLLPALRDIVERICRATALTVSFDHQPLGRLGEEVEACVYRTVHEALMNVVRHSGATHAAVTLARDRSVLVCTVGDDGIGLTDSDHRSSTSAPGLGLSCMRARLASVGGTLSATSLPGQGTTVLMRIPLSEEPAHAN